MNRNPMHTLGLVTMPAILSFALAGSSPAAAQKTPPPPNLSRSL